MDRVHGRTGRSPRIRGLGFAVAVIYSALALAALGTVTLLASCAEPTRPPEVTLPVVPEAPVIEYHPPPRSAAHA